MQEELLQFKLQKVWTLVDLPNRKRAIGSKWVFRNKKDKRGIVIRNKARLVAQGYTQEEGIDYDEVFTPDARIEAIRLFLAYASFKDFVVYQIVYKVKKALYGLHQAPRAWYETLSTYLLDNGFQRGKIKKTLFIKREVMHEEISNESWENLPFLFGITSAAKKDGIFISQDKYVNEILKKFGFTEVKTASTLMETQKPLLKDEDVCDQVLDTKSAKMFTSSYCEKGFFRLISWQCKKQTVVANSTTEAEYVVASSCYGQFWSTVKAKTINEEVQLHALVDGKKIIITKSTVRIDLQLEEAEGS
ncbi:putative ribonuclease H-like domain-containing protein [Tanacetum coccineum]